MLELVNLSNYSTDLELIKNNAEQLSGFLRRNELDGIEMMFCGPWDSSVHRKEWIQGVHLQFWPSWLDFWRGDRQELLRQFESAETITAIYGGLNREDWLERYRENIRQAVAAEAKYVVFHACHNRIAEIFNWNFAANDREVATAFVAVLNELVDSIPPDMNILLENLWWPGLTLRDKKVAAKLLESIRHPNVGMMLDTGHLMNTNPGLRSQQEGIDFVLRTLDELGSYRDSIRGIHLHYSLSGEYITRARQAGPCEPTLDEAFRHVMAIDQHLPFDTPDALRLLNYVQPEWLVHEFVQKSDKDWESKVVRQRRALSAGKNQEMDEMQELRRCMGE